MCDGNYVILPHIFIHLYYVIAITHYFFRMNDGIKNYSKFHGGDHLENVVFLMSYTFYRLDRTQKNKEKNDDHILQNNQ